MKESCSKKKEDSHISECVNHADKGIETLPISIENKNTKERKGILIFVALVLLLLLILMGSCSFNIFFDHINNSYESGIESCSGHTHINASEKWSQDQQSHWYVCSCGETAVAENHVFSSWVTVLQCTEYDVGRKERSCNVCSYKETADILPQGHTHQFVTTWNKNETGHWHECTCGEKSGLNVHEFDIWSVVTSATETVEGRRERMCSVCKYKESAIIPILSHMHSYSAGWRNDSASHWKVCGCGEKSQISLHKYGSWSTTKSSTCISSGSQKHICTTCGYSEIKTISAKGHSYSNGYCTTCSVHDGVTYTIRFDVNANGCSVSTTSKIVKKGEKYGTLPAANRDYYNFLGWYTAKSGGTKVTSSSEVGSGNITLYAHWELKNLSGWVLESQVPTGAVIEDEYWKYDKTTTYWGSWSSWSTSAVSSSSTREVDAKIVTDKEAYSIYRYWRYVNSAGTYAGTYGYNGCTIYQEIKLEYELEWKKYSGVDLYGSYVYNGNTYLKNIWLFGERTDYPAKTHTEYKYRDLKYSYEYDLVSYSKITAGGEISNVRHYVRYRPK